MTAMLTRNPAELLEHELSQGVIEECLRGLFPTSDREYPVYVVERSILASLELSVSDLDKTDDPSVLAMRSMLDEFVERRILFRIVKNGVPNYTGY